MSDDLIRAKGYAIYRHVLKKALTFLMNAVVRAVITDYKAWDAAIVMNVRVRDGKIIRRAAKITIKDRPPLEDLPENLDADTTVIDRTDLDEKLMSSQIFDTVIHSIKELEEDSQ